MLDRIEAAARVAARLSDSNLRLELLVRETGIVAKASIGALESLWLVSWEQISQATMNPLLAALQVVAESVKGQVDG